MDRSSYHELVLRVINDSYPEMYSMVSSMTPEELASYNKEVALRIERKDPKLTQAEIDCGTFLTTDADFIEPMCKFLDAINFGIENLDSRIRNPYMKHLVSECPGSSRGCYCTEAIFDLILRGEISPKQVDLLRNSRRPNK